ncbi:hypothetical protein LPJGGPFB_06579 [Ensifer adhaerens]|uniref:hypothetical protein n=1 Tax=Ensifer adhaerens TaxID=106592 RepID=UPI001568DC37|nr:hypothetical protein [Ensifer adhaerens]NRP23309.1 hypothetical protein [Ensifer adhaerens]
MYTVRERIEEIERSAVRQAEGLLLDAVREYWSASDIAYAARYWDRAKQRLEDAQTWRERGGGSFDLDGIDWGTDDDDPFRVEVAPAPVKIKNKKG